MMSDGAGLRRPFGSLESVADSPDWLRLSRHFVLVVDSIFVAFVLFMWWRLLHVMELRAFLIGFIVYVPFLVVDLVVASGLMSLGMVMLPPVVISLPLKLLLFVLVDGWGLLVRSLLMGAKGG